MITCVLAGTASSSAEPHANDDPVAVRHPTWSGSSMRIQPPTHPPCVPPLRQLDVESAWEETLPPNAVPQIHIDSDSMRNSASSPPERKRI